MKLKLTSLVKGIFKLSFLAAVLVAAAAGSYFRCFDNYELELLDARFVLRGPQKTTNEVVLIEIGDDTSQKLGQWPIDRTYHAMMVKALTKAGASAILFDVLFCEKAEHDDRLEEAIAQSGKVYLPIVFDLNRAGGKSNVVSANAVAARFLENLENKAKGIGHINIVPDGDGKYRRVPLYIQYGGKLYPYVSFLMACDYLGLPQKDVLVLPGKYLVLGDRMKIPLDDNSCLIINFSGKWATSFRRYSFVDILQSYIAGVTGQKPILDLGVFRDKVCLVGLTATGTTDLYPNPRELSYPSLGIHAEVFNSVLNRAFVRRLSREANLYILLILGAFTAAAVMMTRPVGGLVITLIVLGLFVTASVVIFNRARLWIDIFYPVSALSLFYLLFTFFRYIAECHQRRLLEKELDIARI